MKSRILKKIIKSILILFGIILILCFSFYKYFEYRYEKTVDKESMSKLISEIKSSKELPESFYKSYEGINPNGLKNNFFSAMINKTECQSRIISNRCAPILIELNDNRVEYITSFYFCIRDIEKSTTQKECLNWIMQNSDFNCNTIGMENAAKFYYKKNINELNEEEKRVFVKMIKNPTLYNPLRQKKAKN